MISHELLDALDRDEGEVKQGNRHILYDDATGKPLKKGDVIVGNPTIGHGINLFVGITDSENAFFVAKKCGEIERDLMMRLSVFCDLDAIRREALINMAYNLGVDGLLNFRDTIGALKDQDFDRAADEMLNSKWASQVGDRAKRLSKQIRTGERQ